MSTFALGSAAGLGFVVTAAGLLRGRLYATFIFVFLGVHTLLSVALWPHMSWAAPIYIYAQASVFLHFLSLTRPAMRPLPWRALVSVPGSWFAAGTFLALPWAFAAPIFGWLGWSLPAPWLPWAAALIGIYQSLTLRREEVDVVLGGAPVEALGRWRSPPAPGGAAPQRPLTIVQITDPHLGPFMSVERLAAICQRAVDAQPDLIALTGDFLTMEGQGSPDALTQALAPLGAMRGRVVACYGNHDHESPELVSRALAANGVALLNDAATILETGAGRVEILGLDHRWRGRREHIEGVLRAHPRPADVAARIVLLHDPGAFHLLPDGEADLVLSGHTHGGQVGLVSLGGVGTAVSALSKIPDHGLWALGRNRLYVHRGTGHYGFPLRLGVPGEESLLRVWHAPA